MTYRTLTLAFAALFLIVLPRAEAAAPKLAVVGIHAVEKDQARAARLTDSLREAFRQSRAFNTLTEAAVTAALADHQVALREATFLAPARELRREARVYSEEAQFGKAVESLDQAEAFLLYFREHLTTNADYTELLETRAQLSLGLGDADRLDRDLHTLARIAPSARLDPLRFPPQTLDRFKQIQAEMLASTADLDLSSQPAGEKLYLDGAERGATPTVLRGVPLGAHFLRLEDASGQVFFQDFYLSSAGTATLRGDLRPPRLHSATPRDSAEAALNGPMLIRIYQALGRFLKVDYLAISQLDDSGLDLQLLNVSTGRVSSDYLAAFTGEGGDVPQQLRNLVRQLGAELSSDGMLVRSTSSAPKLEPDSNHLLRHLYFGTLELNGAAPQAVAPDASPKASRPFYKRGWFWTVVGGVVVASAGGATAAVLANQSTAPTTVGIQFNLPTP